MDGDAIGGIAYVIDSEGNHSVVDVQNSDASTADKEENDEEDDEATFVISSRKTG